MFKPIRLFNVSVLSFVSLVFSLSFALAEETGLTSLKVGVTGQIRFELRSLWVPEVQCRPNENCPKARPYWSLVIQSQNNQYIVDKAFHLINGKIPSAVELGGVQFKQGSIVKVEGAAISIRDGVFALTEIHKAQLVMGPKWTCKNLLNADPRLVVSIKYAPQKEIKGTYQLEVNRIGDHAIFPIVAFKNAFLKSMPDENRSDSSFQWLFEGSDSVHHVKLEMNQKVDQFNDVPAMLKVEQYRNVGIYGAPIYSEIEMVCSQSGSAQ